MSHSPKSGNGRPATPDTTCPSKPAAPGRLSRLISPVLALAVCGLVFLAFDHLARSVDLAMVGRHLRTIAPSAWTLALLATVVSHVVLVLRDRIALRDSMAKLSRASLWTGSFIGTALGNAAGFGALTGGAVRVRMFGPAGVTAARVGRMTVFTGFTLALALALMTAAGALLNGALVSRMVHVPRPLLMPVALLVLAGFVMLVFLCGSDARRLRSRWRWLSLNVPARRDLLAQTALGVIDVMAAGAALWVFLPADMSIDAVSFLTVYSAALLLGLIGHTPGGIGVFESVMLLVTRSDVPVPGMIAALVAYRLVYFALPLVVGVVLLAIVEGRALRARWRVRKTSAALR